jgi:para-nitrobenzyl esterase
LRAAILSRYPATRDEDTARVALKLFGDYELIASTILTARAAAHRSNVYLYEFSRVSPQNRRVWGGAAHTLEVPYVFDHIRINTGESEEQDKAVSAEMSGAWVQFAKTGNPNGPGLPRWPAYNARERSYLNYGDRIEINAGAYDGMVEFFRGIFVQLRGVRPDR